MKASKVAGRQPLASQFLDVLFLLVLLFGTLFVTTFVFATDDSSASAGGASTVAVSQLPISDAEKGQYTKMVQMGMVTQEDVAGAVAANRPGTAKYSFSWLSLLGTVVLAAGYLLFVYRMSFSEYREVISARFGPRTEADR